MHGKQRDKTAGVTNVTRAYWKTVESDVIFLLFREHVARKATFHLLALIDIKYNRTNPKNPVVRHSILLTAH
jgi:hypothetical protein